MFSPDPGHADAELNGFDGEALDRRLFAFGIGFSASGSQDETGPIQAPRLLSCREPILVSWGWGRARHRKAPVRSVTLAAVSYTHLTLPTKA